MANPKGNPQNLTPWPKGKSGNPGGNNHGKKISSAMVKYLDWTTDDLRDLLNNAQQIDRLPMYEVIAIRQIYRSAIMGKDMPTDRLLDRTEGKLTETHVILGEEKINELDNRLKSLLNIQKNAENNTGNSPVSE